MSRRFVIVLLLTLLSAVSVTHAQNSPAVPYNIGSPQLTNLYISPTGNDGNSGASPDQALQTITAAWERIPIGTTLSETGYHLWILPGVYPPEAAPNFWEARYGTADHPIIIEAVNGPNSVYLPSVNLYDIRYLYLVNLNIEVGSDALHCEKCDHILVRGGRFVGAEPETYNTQETVKFNQSQYIYFEENDISGAWDNAVDFVAVQYGHFIGNHIHNAGDWCMYLKGGSAYFLVEGNEYDDCGVGGFTAGQGTGFQFMSEPWIQYEAYDIKFVNNLIHDTSGAGVGVQGGYNILVAYNTIYRAGERSHVLEFGFGLRTCDGHAGDEGRERCESYRAAGGWGNSLEDDGTRQVRIPNRNVFVYNNLIVNPAGYQSAYQHLTVFPPADSATQLDSNTPQPTRSDDNLQLRGNVIWNGGEAMPLGIEAPDFAAGCQDDNPTCNAAQLRADNAINQFEPQFVGAAQGDFQLLEPLNVTTVYQQSIPDFTWDVPVPAGNISNQVAAVPVPHGSPSPLQLAVIVQSPAETPIAAATSAPIIVAQSFSPATLPPGAVMIVTLGDSLTEGAGDEQEKGGYPGRLISMVDALRPGSTILNIGHSGWSSDALISGDQGLPGELETATAAIQAAAANGQPSVALIWIGSNDLFYLYEYNDPDPAAEQADLEHYAANLDTILSRLSGAGAQVVIALLDDQSFRPVTQAGLAFPGTSKAEVVLMSEQVKRYNQVIIQKAADYGALTVDFYNTTIFTDVITLDYDGNHPNAAGYDIIAGRWFAVLQPLLADA